MASQPFAALREEAWEANQALPKGGLVLFTFGNVSVFDRDRCVFAIKPSGVPYDALLASDLVVVDLEGRVVDGKLRPSSDTKTHAMMYTHFSEISAIAHTHSTHAVAWAQTMRDIPVYGTTHADHTPGPIPCAVPLSDERIAGDYELETGLQIVQEFERRGLNPVNHPFVLVGGHGPFMWGDSGAKAVYHSVVLEEVARIAWLTEQLSPNPQPIKEALIAKHYWRKHGEGKYYGQ